MSRMIAVRLDERLLTRVDRERRKRGISRARAVHEALADWVARRRLAEAVREEAEAYGRHPVTGDEFAPVLGGQRWPK
jgi:metal-responsive CopG/Arc/MetJ family transcriptional regulator